MKVSAVVISHGHADELEHSLPVLIQQVDELLLIANIPGSVPRDLPDGIRVLENERPLSFAGNALLISPDWLMEDGLVRASDFADRSFSPTTIDFDAIKRFKYSRNLIRLIRRSIIDHDQLEIAKRLRQHALDRRVQKALGVIGWQYD